MLAYGLQIPALPTEPGLAGPRRTPWHRLDLATTTGASPSNTQVEIDADRARLDAAGYGQVSLTRAPLAALVTTPRAPSVAELSHPLLAFVGAAVAGWTERVALHAGSVLAGDAAWVVLAAPGGGKSTLMSVLNTGGRAVLADDLTVLDGRTVLAGPRACDLREDAQAELGRGERLANDVGRSRFRDVLGPAPYEAPLGGFVALSWGRSWRVDRPDAARRLALLATHDALHRGPADPRSFLDVLPLPFLTVTRPRKWASLDRLAALLEDPAAATSG